MNDSPLSEDEQVDVLRELHAEGELSDAQLSIILSRREICSSCSQNGGLSILTVRCHNCGCGGLSLLSQRCRLRKWNTSSEPPAVPPGDSRKLAVTNDLEDLFRQSDVPLVSCVMPTYGRPDYVMESIFLFLEQDYPNKELIILNDCPGQLFEGDLPGVRAVNMDCRFGTLGEKRNATIEHASGRIIMVWDDDDIYMPWRLTFSVDEMRRSKAPIYRAERYWGYWDDGELHDNHASFEWMNHSLTAFTRSLWDNCGRYPHQNVREDRQFLLKAQKLLQIPYVTYPLDDADRYFILRGRSSYQHMSMSGGVGPLNVLPGRYPIQPQPIADPLLRAHYERLIQHRIGASQY